MPGLSIQFSSLPAILEAYQNRGVEAWAIFQTKQFMFKGIGFETLENILNVLNQNSSNAIYTLKVYEDVENEKGIKSNTPDDGSFNFRLNGDQQIIRNENFILMNNNALQSKITALEEKILEFENEEIEDDDNFGRIGRILEHPAIAPVIPVIVEGIVKVLTGNPTTPAIQPARQLAGVNEPVNEEKELSEIFESIDKLRVYDKDLNIHLKKLVEIAETKPDFFNLIVKGLK